MMFQQKTHTIITMNLTHQFLIAMPSLSDPNFHKTVTYVCHHDANGAMGIVLNRPLTMELDELFTYMKIDVTDGNTKNVSVLHGGPVQTERGFVIHHPAGDWDSVLKVKDEIGITTSRDILTAIAAGHGPNKAVVALGYAGWDSGQLEQEVAENSWLSGPMDYDIMFNQPFSERWRSATRLIGIDPDKLIGSAGHS